MQNNNIVKKQTSLIRWSQIKGNLYILYFVLWQFGLYKYILSLFNPALIFFSCLSYFSKDKLYEFGVRMSKEFIIGVSVNAFKLKNYTKKLIKYNKPLIKDIDDFTENNLSFKVTEALKDLTAVDLLATPDTEKDEEKEEEEFCEWVRSDSFKIIS